MIENLFTTPNIINGGSVVVAIYLVYSHIKKDAAINKIMSNHLEHDLEQRKEDNISRDNNTKTLQMLIDVIKSFKKK